jgi:hypothetical protein
MSETANHPPLCSPLNIALFCVTVLVLALTTAELLSAPSICALSAYLLIEIRASEVIHNSFLITAVYGLLITSALLFVVILLQWRDAFSLPVLVLRNICNVSVTAFAILLLICTTAEKEIDLRASTIAKWSSAAGVRAFEARHECHGAESCAGPLNVTVADIFTLARRLKIPVGIFWAALLFYGLPSVAIVILGDKRKV